MTHRLRNVSLLVLALTAVASATTQGQQVFPVSSDRIAAPAPLPQAQLDALLAPVALYPDQLLAQVLMASTYPLDVVAAARFVQQNPALTGDGLDQALQQQNWDPSVLSLTAYPQVLAMMSDMLDWTQRLGQAFLANQQQVMDTVQMLRSRAQAAGNLQSSPQQTVMDQDGIIDVEPAQPQYVYVPVYDPRVIYGAWEDQAYLPPYWYPPAIYGYPDFSSGFAVGVLFGTACRISYNHWGWARPNWRGHDIDVDIRNNHFANRPQYVGLWHDGRWTHSPQGRQSAAYRNNGPQLRPNNATIQSPEPFQTRQPAPTPAGNARSTAPQLLTRPLQSPPLARQPQAQPITRWTPQPTRDPARVPQLQAFNRQPLQPTPYAIARSTPQLQQPNQLPQPRPGIAHLSQPQPATRWTPQPTRETARVSRLQAFNGPPLQPTPYAVARNTQQLQRPNRPPPPQPQQGIAHFSQPIAHFVPPRPSSGPPPQRGAPQIASRRPFHAPIQASVSHAPASRLTLSHPSSPADGQRIT